MQTNQARAGKNALTRSFTFLLLSSIIFLTACNNHGHDGGYGGGGPQGFKMNCVTLTSAQVQAWVDSGWTKPGSEGEIKALSFQFCTAAPSALSSSMQLICYPGETYTKVKVNGKTLLAIDTTCVTTMSTGTTIFGNNVVPLEALKIFNADGTLTKFDYIKFTPAGTYTPYINFKIEVVRNGIPQATDGGGTWPCPTYCY